MASRLKRIERLVQKNNGPLTVESIAERQGISLIEAQRVLDRLETKQRVVLVGRGAVVSANSRR